MSMRLFVDMDGTLAEWRRAVNIEALYERGYFANLHPCGNVVEAIRQIIDAGYEVYVLSGVLADSKYAVAEKRQWIARWLPEIPEERCLFPPCGTRKEEYVSGGIRSGQDYLLDDYTKNLNEWSGVGIKLLNGLNHTHSTWTGSRVSGYVPAHELAHDVIDIMDGALIRHPVPRPANLRNILILGTGGTGCRVINACGEELFFSEEEKEIRSMDSYLRSLLSEAHLLVIWDRKDVLRVLGMIGFSLATIPLLELGKLPEGMHPLRPTRNEERLLQYYWKTQYPAAPRGFTPGVQMIQEEISEELLLRY